MSEIKCLVCGETNPKMFGKGRTSRCKKCFNKIRKEKRNEKKECREKKCCEEREENLITVDVNDIVDIVDQMMEINDENVKLFEKKLASKNDVIEAASRTIDAADRFIKKLAIYGIVVSVLFLASLLVNLYLVFIK